MAEPKNRARNTAGSSLPGSWTYYLVSALGVSSSLAIAGLVFATFWLNRPVDLTPRTMRLADQLELALVDHYVPPENIQRGAPEPQSLARGDQNTRWTLHPFRVTLPPQLNHEGLREILRDDMSAYDVRVMETERDPDEPGVERLAFYLDDFRFAEMGLLPGAEETDSTMRSDLREPSQRLARLTEGVLGGLDPDFTAEKAVPREDLNSMWSYTHFSANLPRGMTLGALKQRLADSMERPDARVETGPVAGLDANVTITLGGRPCVGIACTTTPDTPAAAPDTVTLDGILDAGIQGSEPEEPAGPAGEAMAAMPEPAPVDETASAPPLDPEAPDEAPPAPTPPPARSEGMPKPRLAIIIDDGGYVKAHSERVLALDPRLTLAILPNTPHGADTAREGAELGFEIMLHMPMETESGTEPAVEGTVYTAMGKKEIQKLTGNALDQYPEVVGINNHTGSKFTANAEKLKHVFAVLKERDLFFIDSYTKATSVAYETARDYGIPTARRDVFLDNRGDEESIRAQFDALVERAVKQGSAIGIGHFQHAGTAAVLAEEIPKLEKAGIELVHASELVQ